MSWGVGEFNGRDIGYGVPAICDHPGCGVEIDRGLSYVCGSNPYGGAFGCGLFFCWDHLGFAGEARDHVRLCSRCRCNRGAKFTPTPDRAKWINHKLTDESWQRWRDECPEQVAECRAALARATGETP